jgi:hypothetical protein
MWLSGSISFVESETLFFCERQKQLPSHTKEKIILKSRKKERTSFCEQKEAKKL